MTGKTKLLVIIPAYNEQESVRRVIKRVRQSVPQADILVVDDGSSDGTAVVAMEEGVFVASLLHNLGIGAAVQTGYIFAFEKGYDVAVRVDGDGQHDPAEIPRLMSALWEGDADVVVGSRFLTDQGFQTSFARRLGIVILARLIALVTGQSVTDPTSGFLAAGHDATRFFAKEYPHDYPEPEGRVLLRRAGFKVKEVPVSMSPRLGGRSSITTVRSFYYMAKVTLAILIGLLRKPPQRSREDDAKG
jgi:glycosyltransferase involved in cell wall biosynthesis